jgi:hypothetical protein
VRGVVITRRFGERAAARLGRAASGPVEALFAGNVKVVFELVRGELVTGCLDLDERGPALGSAADTDEAVGVELLVAEAATNTP